MSYIVRHLQQYNNCISCRAGDGLLGSSYFDFVIQLNSATEKRYYKDVSLRHLPFPNKTNKNRGLAVPNSYMVLPAWKYTVPYNIMRSKAGKFTISRGKYYRKVHLIGPVNCDYHLLKDIKQSAFHRSEYPGESGINLQLNADGRRERQWRNKPET